MKLRTRLLIAFLMISITPFAVIGTISLVTSESALSELAFSHLESMREEKKAWIRMFLAERKVNMDILMKTVTNFRQAAFEKLKTVQEIKKAQAERYFRKILNDITVLSENAVVQELGAFDSVLDGKGGVKKEVYEFHEEQYFGNSLKQFRDTYGHADLLLITKKGDIVYTVARGSDLGQNLLTGPLKSSSLSRCFQEGLKGIAIQDFEPYSPFDNQYMAFVAAPVLKHGKIVGVVALRIDNQGLNTIVQRRRGMGKTGETYVAGRQNDKISFRSDRKVKEGKIGQTISEDYVETALSGQSGTAVRTDSNGEMNFISYDPLEISGLNWAIITMVSLEEAVAPRLEGEEKDYFAMYIGDYGYSDLFLIHPQGNIFYSVGHHPDYGTNILTGTYSNSGLGRLVREVRETGKFGFVDFEPYEPFQEKPAAFVAQPLVLDDNVELVVALRLSLDTINKVMGGRAGMGETGETYLVGPDRLMRSDSYSDPVNHSAYASFANPEKGIVDTRSVRESLAGKTGRDMAGNYKGKEVLSAYTPLVIWDTTWSLITEIPTEEAFAAVKALKWVTTVIAIIAIAVIIIVSFVLAGYIAKPVASLTSAVQEVSDGNLSVSAPVSTSKELGLLALTFNKMTTQLRETLDSLRSEIEERKIAEAGLVRLTAILEATSDLVGMATPNSNLIYMNRAGRKLLGWWDDDLAGKIIPDVHPESVMRIVVKEGIPAAIKHGVWEGEAAIRGPDDSEIPVSQVIMSHRSLDGKLEYISSIMRDITERKRAEEDLQNAYKGLENRVEERTTELRNTNQELQKAKLAAEAANQAKSEFLTNISHELRNPMHQILSYSKYGVEKIDKPKEKLLHYFDQTRKAAERLMVLLNDLLDLSKMESGRMDYRMESNDVFQIINEAVSELKLAIEEKNLLLKLNNPSILTKASCDSYKIGQVVRNLISNAIKFTTDGKKIEIRFQGNDVVSKNNTIPAIQVSVCDQGVGIPENEITLVFDKFTQSTKTKTGAGGTGLGLAICKEIIEAHHGKIWAENNPEGGSTFSFVLPYEQKTN